MAARTALALCSVGVRLGVQRLLGKRCSLRGNAIAELNMTLRLVCHMALCVLGNQKPFGRSS